MPTRNTTLIISNAALGVILSNSVTGTFIPPPTNIPPVGNQVFGPFTSFDASSNTIVVTTNIFSLAAYVTNPVVLAARVWWPGERNADI